jgi:hypothetical protein
MDVSPEQIIDYAGSGVQLDRRGNWAVPLGGSAAALGAFAFASLMFASPSSPLIQAGFIAGLLAPAVATGALVSCIRGFIAGTGDRRPLTGLLLAAIGAVGTIAAFFQLIHLAQGFR